MNRPDSDKITFDTKLIGGQTQARVDRRASETGAFVRFSANEQRWRVARDEQSHRASSEIEFRAKSTRVCRDAALARRASVA